MVPTLLCVGCALQQNITSIDTTVLRVVHARNEQRRTLLDGGIVFIVGSSVSSREDDEETAG